MNAELLAVCRVRQYETNTTKLERHECRVILRKAATIRECNVGLSSLACDGGLAGPLRFAPSIADAIHANDPVKSYDLNNAAF